MLIRIKAPHFVAGVVLNADGRVERAAPIVRYMMGWSLDRISGYCLRKGWRLT
jgi:hypothetical protein